MFHNAYIFYHRIHDTAIGGKNNMQKKKLPIPEDLYKQVEKQAEELGQNPSEYVTRAVMEKLTGLKVTEKHDVFSKEKWFIPRRMFASLQLSQDLTDDDVKALNKKLYAWTRRNDELSLTVDHNRKLLILNVTLLNERSLEIVA